MTHYAQLAEAVEYPHGPGEELTLRGSRATLDDLVDHFLDNDLDGFSEEHPGVSDYHIERIADILADIVRDVPDERSVRRQLKSQAHWAVLSDCASQLIEQEVDNLSEPSTGEELLTLARRAISYLQPAAAAIPSGQTHERAGAGEQSHSRKQASTSQSGSSEQLQQPAAELADCSSRIRNAADQLQTDRPVHAAYTRELASRIDELLADLLPPGTAL